MSGEKGPFQKTTVLVTNLHFPLLSPAVSGSGEKALFQRPIIMAQLPRAEPCLKNQIQPDTRVPGFQDWGNPSHSLGRICP